MTYNPFDIPALIHLNHTKAQLAVFIGRLDGSNEAIRHTRTTKRSLFDIAMFWAEHNKLAYLKGIEGNGTL